ncbi:NAD(P)-dependent oxidoreductase [Maribacter hydrothermalis]|uniref:NAD-dependent epimerase n=1 Tax=Maribacter hydrothermalis TaxID=1836467 RepID=A0A1B7Z8B0_9FLAO|nr:NAD(P)-binding oxidoreductase [Maribacter hydrothermalis]APQ19043.1 NAD-dependent epimerase [Maribacter hydrothermalis]OBR38944.1 NAD-dependent epimerase [Maribacter hydrothermalis]
MTVLVVGASGATGSQLVTQLLHQNNSVKIIVRSPEKLPESWKSNDKLQIITASILNLTDSEMQDLVSDCHAVATCLGHNLTLKGMYGQPRKLVTEATRRLCKAIKANNLKSSVKFVLMNTTGVRNRDIDEPIFFAQKCVIGLLRVLLPPHVDNENAADYLRTQIGQNNSAVDWVAVRPDGLINEDQVNDYEIFQSPTRSAIFNAGKVSRINVAHFMASLINDENLWRKWKGQMPVIYSTAQNN